MTALPRLLAEIRKCDVCKTMLPFGPRPVLQAAASARILIAGQAPGRKVHETGIPFNDPSGDRLRLWLGVTKEQFYDAKLFAVVPMGFCFPGTGSGGDAPPRPECALKWRSRLLEKLPNVQLTLVLGQYALEWHLRRDRRASLTETVQAWRDYEARGLLPLPHPSPRNVRWFAANPWFDAEVVPMLRKRVRKLLA